MSKSDPNDSGLADGNTAGKGIQQAITMCLNADSCPPPLPSGFRRSSGTMLLDLEMIIREQLESGGRGSRTSNDKNMQCGRTQEFRKKYLLDMARKHNAK